MAQNKKYVFAQRDVDDFSCIKLTEGPFSDIIYTYTNVKFASEENANGQLPLKLLMILRKILIMLIHKQRTLGNTLVIY